ncbi:ABC transporter permease [Ethanoligenens sp.]|uniref:ABC transporter permease n=1 Tax=Ethanoligenens sp. TaxID=2099655 RepID=UPI0039EAC33D
MEKRSTVVKTAAVKPKGPLWIAVVVMLVLVLAFEIVPAIYILLSGFQSDTGFTLENYVQVFTGRYYTQAIVNSVVLSVVSSLLGIVIGTCAALCIRGMNEHATGRIITILNMTTNYTGIPLAFAFIVLLGSNGVVTLFLKNVMGINVYAQGFSLFSWFGITLVYVYFQIPLAIMLMYPAAASIKDSLREAASMLGASGFLFWMKIGIPTLLPALLGGICILFANALGAYATAYALVSGNKGIIAIAIANLVSGDVNPNPYLASALSTVLGGILMVMVFAKSRLNRRMV